MNTSARATPGQRFVVSHYDEKDFTSTSPRAYLLKRLADFQYFYVLKGWQRMLVEGHGEVTVRAHDGWLQPPAIEHQVLDYSDDLEVLCFSMPAEFDTEDA